jgi:hypothetical protein
MNTTVTALPIAVRQQQARRKQPRALRKLRIQALAASAVCSLALAVVGLSLTDLAEGIQVVTGATEWKAWALAVGIDLGFVALELSTMAAATDKLRRSISRYTSPAIVGTLSGSAVLNAFAFASNAAGYMVYPAAVLGVAIPTLVYALTRVGATMWIDRRNAS